MKIYYHKGHNDFYFMTSRKNGLWSMDLDFPDINTLTLNETHIGDEGEEKAFNEAIEVSYDTYVQFSRLRNVKNNYKPIAKILLKTFPDMTEDDINKAYKRDTRIVDITNDIIKEYNDSHRVKFEGWQMKHYYTNLMQEVRNLLHTWNDDVDRVKEYIRRDNTIGDFMCVYHAMVDIFGECHPTERMLLHKYYDNSTAKKYIDDAVAKYPDKDDFDKALYYVQDMMGKENEDILKSIKERQKKNG